MVKTAEPTRGDSRSQRFSGFWPGVSNLSGSGSNAGRGPWWLDKTSRLAVLTEAATLSIEDVEDPDTYPSNDGASVPCTSNRGDAQQEQKAAHVLNSPTRAGRSPSRSKEVLVDANIAAAKAVAQSMAHSYWSPTTTPQESGNTSENMSKTATANTEALPSTYVGFTTDTQCVVANANTALGGAGPLPNEARSASPSQARRAHAERPASLCDVETHLWEELASYAPNWGHVTKREGRTTAQHALITVPSKTEKSKTDTSTNGSQPMSPHWYDTFRFGSSHLSSQARHDEHKQTDAKLVGSPALASASQPLTPKMHAKFWNMYSSDERNFRSAWGRAAIAAGPISGESGVKWHDRPLEDMSANSGKVHTSDTIRSSKSESLKEGGNMSVSRSESEDRRVRFVDRHERDASPNSPLTATRSLVRRSSPRRRAQRVNDVDETDDTATVGISKNTVAADIVLNKTLARYALGVTSKKIDRVAIREAVATQRERLLNLKRQPVRKGWDAAERQLHMGSVPRKGKRYWTMINEFANESTQRWDRRMESAAALKQSQGEAATVLQSRYRGKVARQSIQDRLFDKRWNDESWREEQEHNRWGEFMHDAAVHIQARYRGKAMQRRVDGLRYEKDKAATNVQRRYRGKMAKQSVATKREEIASAKELYFSFQSEYRTGVREGWVTSERHESELESDPFTQSVGAANRPVSPIQSRKAVGKDSVDSFRFGDSAQTNLDRTGRSSPWINQCLDSVAGLLEQERSLEHIRVQEQQRQLMNATVAENDQATPTVVAAPQLATMEKLLANSDAMLECLQMLVQERSGLEDKATSSRLQGRVQGRPPGQATEVLLDSEEEFISQQLHSLEEKLWMTVGWNLRQEHDETSDEARSRVAAIGAIATQRDKPGKHANAQFGSLDEDEAATLIQSRIRARQSVDESNARLHRLRGDSFSAAERPPDGFSQQVRGNMNQDPNLEQHEAATVIQSRVRARQSVDEANARMLPLEDTMASWYLSGSEV